MQKVSLQLVPSAQTETPIVDVNAAGESMVLVPGNTAAITATYSTTIGTAQNLYVGSSVMPSSISLTCLASRSLIRADCLKHFWYPGWNN